MRKILFILLIFILNFYVLAGCKDNKKESPERAVSDIILCYNNEDIMCFWQHIYPKDRYSVSQNIIANINKPDLFTILGYALHKDNVTSDNISAEEYIYGSFKIILGDKEMELSEIEVIDEYNAQAVIKMGEKTAIMPVINDNGKWYIRLK